MKNNHAFMILFGVVSIVLILCIFLLKTPPFWKTFSKPTVSVTFKYPANWHVCEENFSNLSFYSVHILPISVLCDDNYYGKSSFIIIDDPNLTTTESDIRNWISNWNILSKIRKDIDEAQGKIPSTGESSWNFINYKNSLISNQPKNTVAEVEGTTKYLVLNNGHIYQIDFMQKNILNKHILNLIFKTIEFKVSNFK